MKRAKKILVLFLSLVMVLGLLPTVAMAQTEVHGTASVVSSNLDPTGDAYYAWKYREFPSSNVQAPAGYGDLDQQQFFIADFPTGSLTAITASTNDQTLRISATSGGQPVNVTGFISAYQVSSSTGNFLLPFSEDEMGNFFWTRSSSDEETRFFVQAGVSQLYIGFALTSEITADTTVTLTVTRKLAGGAGDGYATVGSTYSATYTFKADYTATPNNNVARIGHTEYATLAEAVAAAVTESQNNNTQVTVHLLRNVADGTGIALFNTAKTADGITYPAATAANIVIDFGGHTYTVAQPPVGSSGTQNQALHFEQGNTVTLKNGTINMTSDSARLAAFDMIMQNYCNLTIDGMTINGTGIAVKTYGSSYSAPWGGSNKPQFNYNSTGTSVIRNSTIIAEGDMGIDDTANVTIKSNATIRAAKIVTKGTDERYSSANPTITIENGAKFSWNGISAILSDSQELSDVSNGLYTVQAKKIYVAQIGETKYETLMDAVDAVPTDGTQTTITMIADVTTYRATVKSGQSIVLELNGHTISTSTGVNAPFNLNKGNSSLTIQDSKGNGRVSAPYVVYNVLNSSTLTVKSGSFVLSSGVNNLNSGSITITGGTFDHDPTQYVPVGYEATQSEGLWTVQKANVTVTVPSTLNDDTTAAVEIGGQNVATVEVTIATAATVEAVEKATAATVTKVEEAVSVSAVVQKAMDNGTIVANENTIQLLVKADDTPNAVPNVTVAQGAAVIKVDPYAIVNGNTANPIKLTNDDLAENSTGFTFTLSLGAGFANKTVTLKHYSDAGVLKDSWNATADASGNVEVTLTSFSYIVGEAASSATVCAGYLYNTDADIRASLLWNVYFYIDTTVIANPLSAKIVVSSDYDDEIDELECSLTKVGDYYKITVPIRPRLIDQEVGFTLVYNNTEYNMKLGENGQEYLSVPYSFNAYLTGLAAAYPAYADVITALRAYRDALLAKWPVSNN